jgi:putative hydrolase of the HAD superfamily
MPTSRHYQSPAKSPEEVVNSSLSELACVVFVDADNTLWDTNRVYADAQLKLLEQVERAVGHQAPTDNRLGWLRQIDQALAERHRAGLRYPPRLMVEAAALVLKGVDISEAVEFATSGTLPELKIDDTAAGQIEALFLFRLMDPPTLRKGVGVKMLHAAGCPIVVLTEDSRENVLRLLEHHGLARFITRVIEVRKARRLFERLVTLMGRSAHAFMIGDQLDRDIAPAKAAGLITIFFPGGFNPKWHPAESAVQPDFRVKEFDQAALLVLDDVARVRARGAPA